MSDACTGMRDTLRLWLTASLCGLLPPLLLVALGLYILRVEHEHRVESAKEQLDSSLGRVAARLDPATRVRNRLQLLATCFNGAERKYRNNEKNILTYAANAAVEPYVFDSAGALRPSGGIRLTAKFVMRNLWMRLVAPPSSNAEAEERKLRKTFCAALGTDFRVSDLRLREGIVQEFRVRQKDGYIFWQRRNPLEPRDLSGCLLVNWSGPDQAALLKELSAGKKLKNTGRDRNAMQLFVRMPKSRWKRIAGPRIRRIPRDLRPMLADKGAAPVLVGDRLWMHVEAGEAEILASKRVHTNDLVRIRDGILFLGLSMSFLGLLLVRRVMENAALRAKLALVFVLASALPNAGLGFLGYQMLRDRRDTLVTEFGNAGRELLMEIDREFDTEAVKYLAEFRRIRDDGRWRTQRERAVADALERIQNRQLGSVEARDIYGSVCMNAHGPVFLEGMEGILDVFARVCMEGGLPPGRLRLEKRPVDPMAKMVFDTPEMGFPFIVAHPDTVHLFRIGNRSMMWYWDVYRDPTHPFAYINIVQPMMDAARRYLEKRLKCREGRNGIAWRLMAYETSRESWLPAGIRAGNPLLQATQRVQLTRQPWSGRVQMENGFYGVTVVPGERIPGFTLIALHPESAIDREISAGRDLLFVAMSLILLIAFLTGGVLADTFLVPVGELARGLAALRERSFDVLLSTSGKDELGDLTNLFNTMVEKLRQMNMARSVQEALIPETLPQIPGWDFDIFNLTASDLGGDYCDLILLHDGKLLFLLGDVTGHGADSALLMVMVKAAVMRLAESATTPEDLMNRLNRLIFRLMKRRKMMTCVVGMLDPQSGRICMVNSGHPYPFRRGHAGDVEEIHSVGFPLGLSEKKLKLQPVEICLAPGDAVILYTDGLVEGMDADGNMFGYERIHGTARVIQAESAKSVREGMITAFMRHHHSSKLEDDLTMIVLRKNA